MIFFKPMPAVEPKGVPATKNIINVPKAPRLVMNIDGTLSPIEDHLNWDFDKLNRAGE